MFLKIAQRCPKLHPRAVPRSCSPKLFLKAAVQSCCPKAVIFQTYTPKWLPKIILQSGPGKLLPQNCFVKLPQKLLPKAALLQGNYSSKLFRKACQNCSPKRFPEAASQGCSPKYFCKDIAPKRLCFKPLPHSGSPKLFFKTASWCQKLLPKIAF